MLLVESGPRSLAEAIAPVLRRVVADQLEIDVVTCYEGAPEGVSGRIFNVNDYGGPAGRHALWVDLSQRGYAVAGILCSGQPIMTKWKWWLAAKLPAKILVINENADCFWLDRDHLRNLRGFIAVRAGLTGGAALPTLARLLFFPVTLAYLLLYAGAVHLRRRIRLL
jgi:hypothetical protein